MSKVDFKGIFCDEVGNLFNDIIDQDPEDIYNKMMKDFRSEWLMRVTVSIGVILHILENKGILNEDEFGKAFIEVASEFKNEVLKKFSAEIEEEKIKNEEYKSKLS